MNGAVQYDYLINDCSVHIFMDLAKRVDVLAKKQDNSVKK